MENLNEESQGLSQAEAEQKLVHFGPNRLTEVQKLNFLDIAKEEVAEPMILLLIFVGIVYTVFGSLQDALTIFSIIFVLVFVEIWNEYRAKKAISALSDLAAPRTRVLRDSNILEVATENVVPGDVLVLTPGTRIAADCRLQVAYGIEIDESILTGESIATRKDVGDEVYAGTLCVSGEGKGEVYETGRKTKFGKISALAQTIRQPKTPLQLAMKSLSKALAWVAIFFSIFIPVLGFFRYGSTDVVQLILTGLALAFAAIPEELPIIITMILGMGAYTLSKKNFLVKKLKAAEVLGDATVILTDKTGTITEGRMHVAEIFPKADMERTVRAATLALTEMSLSSTDKAILEKNREMRIEMDPTLVLNERGFEKGKNTRAVVRRRRDGVWLSAIGAPEEILSSRPDDVSLKENLGSEAIKGRRVIGVAEKRLCGEERDMNFSKLEKDWDFVGLISIEDPPREGVKETIQAMKKAGITTIMVTGDYPQTAANIAKSVGIPYENVMAGEEVARLSTLELEQSVRHTNVFARTMPHEKYRLVQALQASGEIVAVTGDGVNDALALRGANVGIAMGVKGTDAAKEAADVVLADDNFVNIGTAVFEGRKFFDNLGKGLKYYLSVKLALISIFLLPLVLGVPLPFAPIQIIVLELFMDLAASIGFVTEAPEKTIYTRGPRNPKTKFPDTRMIIGIILSGASLFAAVMLAYFYAQSQGMTTVQVQTFAFSAWIMGHIILAFISRSEKEPLYNLGLFSNRVMDAWAILAISFLILAVSLPSLALQLKLTTLTASQLGLILAFSLITIVWQEIVKIILSKSNSRMRDPTTAKPPFRS